MIIACPECNVNYTLDPKLLGEHGRRVLCTECRHAWFQKHVGTRDISSLMADTTEIDVFEAAPAQHPDSTPDAQESFEAILKKTAAAVTPSIRIPDAVMPGPVVVKVPAPQVYKPMGVGPFQFGALTFLCCMFLTLIGIFLGRGPLVRLWPQADLLCSAIGLPVPAPGEGLRLGGFTAENRIDKSKRTLLVQGELVNMTRTPAPYPAMEVKLSSSYGAPLKTLTLDNKTSKSLAPGESVPVKLELKDAPEGAADVDIKVIAP